MSIKNLWGEIEPADVNSPLTILKEQSQVLSEITNELLRGYAKYSKQDGVWFCHDFYINAPSLNNYACRLLTISIRVTHDYPVFLTKNEGITDLQCINREEFEIELNKILSSPHTKSLISGLLSKIKATSLNTDGRI